MSCPSFGRELLRRRDLDRRELEALQEAFEALHFDGPAKGSPRHASHHSTQRLRGRKPVLPSGHFDMKLNTIRVDGARSAASAWNSRSIRVPPCHAAPPACVPARKSA
jgi:hypothetical protein